MNCDENLAAACKRLWRAAWAYFASILSPAGDMEADVELTMDRDEQIVRVVESLKTSVETLLSGGATQFTMDVAWERMDTDFEEPFCITPRISIKVGGGK